MQSVKIIVVTHKKYRMPNDSMYIPMHVGAEGRNDQMDNGLDLEYVKDNTGDNISYKNKSFCELTGLYWAWKNLNDDFVGLVHYRRYLAVKKKSKDSYERVLTSAELQPMLCKYRVILPKKRHYYIESLYSHYKHTHYAEHLDKAKEIIKKKNPEYVESYERVVKQTYGYMFNIMIMDRILLDDYCTWLFGILFELEKQINMPNLSLYQGRFYGRVSEIMFNVWLDYKVHSGALGKNDVKELPCIHMEKINWWEKTSAFLQAKFLHKRYEGSF